MKHLSVIFLTVSALLPAFGQTPVPAPANPETVEITFSALAWSDAINGVFFKNPKAKPVAIYSHIRSSLYTYRGKADQPLTFYRSKKAADDTVIDEPVAMIAPQDLKNHSLLLFIPSAEDPSHYNIKVLDDRVESLPAGGYKFVNYTDRMLGITIGEQKQLLASGGDAVLIPKPSGEDQSAMGIQMFIDDNGTAKRVYANRWVYQPKVRSLIFIINDPESKRVILKGIDETVTPTP